MTSAILRELETLLVDPESNGNRRFIALALCEYDRMVAKGLDESAALMIQEAGARLDLCNAPVRSFERDCVFARMDKFATWRGMLRKNVA